MSKTEYMGVSPSQVSCQTGNYSCHKQSPSGQKHEFGAESVHSEPSEQKRQPDFEILEDEPRETITAVSSQLINENLQTISENVTNNCFTENLELPPKDVHESSQTGKCLCSQKDISEQKLEFGSGSCEPSEEFQKLGSQLVENELVETCTTVSSFIASEQLGPPCESVTKSSPIEHLQPPTEDAIKVPSTGQLGSLPEDVAKNSSLEQLETPPENAVKDSIHLGHRDRRTSKSLKKKHMIKSLVNSDRVLRSRSREKPKAPESSKNLTNVSSGGEENKKRRRRRRKKKRRVNRRVADEYSRVRAQVRYFLNRISYEQSLIAAYSGEGWKGLSLEKLKPEKELQRATSEILRRKLKIRDLFQRLDSLCAEGRFPESLFDSEGQIDSEDIFCAKCGSKDLSADNDIILCDGACDRGFHQFCLEPPLLKEDIPPDDDGWLCPGCDCKVDCLDLLNESQGTNLSITDKWEKVFPEAAAGHNHDPNFGLPSDDSDDNDYDPEGPQSDEKDQGDESSSDDSDFTSASDELGTPPNDEQHLGLSSDDSEDDDYDPDGPDLDNNVKLESSSSDFTSDSEDLGAALDDNMSSGKDEGPMPMSPIKGSNSSKLGGKKRQSLNSELLSILELDPGQDGSAPVSGKRNVERLDYKKLHDEEYGNVSSHSSDDEDWSDPCLAKEEYGNVSSHSSDDEDWTDTFAPRNRQKSTGEVALESPKGNAPVNKSGININDIKQNLKMTENTPKRRTHHKLNFEDAKPAKSHEGSSNSGSSNKKSAYRRLGKDVTQRLYKSFKETQYPDRITKENLAKELDITFRQVSKWFENARWSFNHSSCMDADIAQSSSKKKTPSPQTNKRPLEQGPETRTRDATCNGAQSEDAPKADVAVTKCCSVDARASESVTHENGRKKSITPTSRKRKGKMDHQSSDPDSRIEEMQNLPDDVPKPSDMQTGSKIRTRRRKSVA